MGRPMGRASIASNLVMSGFVEASDGAIIHRCHKHVLSTSRNASYANEFEPFSGCPHLPILILHSLSGLLCRLLRAWRELERNLPQCSLKRKKRASSEMSPLIAAHAFSWAWRYNRGSRPQMRLPETWPHPVKVVRTKYWTK